MSNLLTRCTNRLKAYADAGLTRTRLTVQARKSQHLQLQDNAFISFASNDYLNLSQDKRVIEALYTGAKQYGTGSGASSAVSGYTQAHAELEKAICKHTHLPRAILFPSGYLANLGVLTSLPEKNDVLLCDHDNHASLIDAGLLSSATMHRYQAGNLMHLKKQLIKQQNASHRFIVTEGVFSTDGRVAELEALMTLSQQYRASLIVDDAHGFGVMGKQGQGSLRFIDTLENTLYLGTLGKACGTAGAFVAGAAPIIDALQQFARPYQFTIALSPALCVASTMSIQIMQAEPERFEQLRHNIAYLHAYAKDLNLPFVPGTTPIAKLPIGDEVAACEIVEKAKAQGLLLSVLRYPTVKRKQACIRISLCAAHTHNDIEQALNFLKVHHNVQP